MEKGKKRKFTWTSSWSLTETFSPSHLFISIGGWALRPGAPFRPHLCITRMRITRFTLDTLFPARDTGMALLPRAYPISCTEPSVAFFGAGWPRRPFWPHGVNATLVLRAIFLLNGFAFAITEKEKLQYFNII